MEYPLGQQGGVEVLVRALICGLSPHYQILLVSPDTPESLRKIPEASHVSKHIPLRLPHTVESATRLATELALLKPDVVHFNFGGIYTWATRSAKRSPVWHVIRKGLRCFATNHGAFSVVDYCAPYRPQFLKWSCLPPFWWSRIQATHGLVCELTVSDHDARLMRRWFPPLKRKIRRLYHARPRSVLPSHPPPREPLAVCLGTVGYRKGQDILAEAFIPVAARYPNWTLVIAGRCGDPKIEARIADFRGQLAAPNQLLRLTDLDDSAVRELLLRASLFVMPSRSEGLGLALQEALYLGLPAIGTRVGGIPELIDSGATGLLVCSGKVAELSTALERMMSDPNLRQAMGARGNAAIVAKGMTYEAMVRNYHQILDEMLGPVRFDAHL